MVEIESLETHGMIMNTHSLPLEAARCMRAFVFEELPITAQTIEGSAPAEKVVNTLIGNMKLRSSPVPNEASLVKMRDLAERHILDNTPIPILVPMGPKKTIPSEGVDIAEIGALKTLAALADRIRTVHHPGVDIAFRLEDVTGWYLEKDVPDIHQTIEAYLSGFESLIRVLGYQDFMRPVRESSLVDFDLFSSESRKYINPLLAYIRETDEVGLDNYQDLDSWKKLDAIGWQGEIPKEQRDFYRDRYRHLYPNKTPAEIDLMLATYLGTTLARYKLKSACPPDMQDGHFQLNFAPPVPGTPPNLISTRVYYRTLPKNVTKTHIPFWRAKGVIKKDANKAPSKPSLISWGSEDAERCKGDQVTISTLSDTVDVKTNYLSL